MGKYMDGQKIWTVKKVDKFAVFVYILSVQI